MHIVHQNDVTVTDIFHDCLICFFRIFSLPVQGIDGPEDGGKPQGLQFFGGLIGNAASRRTHGPRHLSAGLFDHVVRFSYRRTYLSQRLKIEVGMIVGVVSHLAVKLQHLFDAVIVLPVNIAAHQIERRSCVVLLESPQNTVRRFRLRTVVKGQRHHGAFQVNTVQGGRLKGRMVP